MKAALSIVLCSFFGLTAATSLALGCSIWSPTSSRGPYSADDDDQRWWQEHAPSGFTAGPIEIDFVTGFGVRSSFMSVQPPGALPGNHVFVTRTGWPVQCTGGEVWVDRSSEAQHRRSVVYTPTKYPFARSQVLPLRPLWIGLIVNAFVFGVLAFGGLRAARAIIRIRRSRLGLCRNCRCPLREGTTCSECGWAAVRSVGQP